MALRVTRPGFIYGIQALAEGEAEVPHLPTVQKWREGSRAEAYDPNVDAGMFLTDCPLKVEKTCSLPPPTIVLSSMLMLLSTLSPPLLLSWLS